MSDQPEPLAAEQSPVVRVVRGRPSPEDLAALVVVLAASAGGPSDDQAPARSVWASSGRAQVPHAAGPGAWRASALPR